MGIFNGCLMGIWWDVISWLMSINSIVMNHGMNHYESLFFSIKHHGLLTGNQTWPPGNSSIWFSLFSHYKNLGWTRRISQQTMTGGDLPGFTAAQTETKTERPKVGIQSPLLFIYNLPVQYITCSWKIWMSWSLRSHQKIVLLLRMEYRFVQT